MTVYADSGFILRLIADESAARRRSPGTGGWGVPIFHICWSNGWRLRTPWDNAPSTSPRSGQNASANGSSRIWTLRLPVSLNCCDGEASPLSRWIWRPSLRALTPVVRGSYPAAWRSSDRRALRGGGPSS